MATTTQNYTTGTLDTTTILAGLSGTKLASALKALAAFERTVELNKSTSKTITLASGDKVKLAYTKAAAAPTLTFKFGSKTGLADAAALSTAVNTPDTGSGNAGSGNAGSGNATAYSLAAGSAIITEGSSTTFTVTRTGDSTKAAILLYNITGDNSSVNAATPGADTSTASGTVTVAAGATTATFTVSATADSATEGLEGFKVSLFDGTTGAALGVTKSGVINDDLAAPVAGQTKTLTTDIDVLSGGAGNDTFISDAASATTADQLAGGAGTDTFKLYGGAGAADIPTLSSIEVVELVDNTVDTDLSTVAELTTLKLTNSDTGQIYTAAANVNFELAGMADTDIVTLATTATDTSHTISVTDMGSIAAGAVTVNADGASVTTLNIVTSGTVAAGTDSRLALASTGTETTVNVSGGGDLQLDVLAASVVTLGASAATGNLTITMGATTTATSVTTGSGGDTVTATAAVDYNISLNGGNDTLITADAVGELTAADSFDGGAGTDVFGVVSAVAADLDDGSAADTAILARITGFERLRITNNLADDFDISAWGYNTLQLGDDVITGGGTTVTVSGFTSGATVTFRDNANMTDTLVIGMTGATSAGSTSDTLNLQGNANLGAGNNREYNVQISGINIVNISAADRDNTDLATDGSGDGYTFDLDGDGNGGDANLNTVNISGDMQVTYNVSATATALATINASAATGVQVISANLFVGTQGLAITGGSRGDTLTGAPAVGDLIVGGAGNDTINGGTGADIYTGGTGVDTLRFTSTANYTGGTPSASVFDTVSDYAKAADIIDETTGALTILGDANTVASVGVAAISLTTGIATFAAADDTLTERIIAVEAGLTFGTEASNNFAIFEHGGNTYVFIHDGTAGLANTDGLIKLTGITGITSVDLTTSTGNLILA